MGAGNVGFLGYIYHFLVILLTFKINQKFNLIASPSLSIYNSGQSSVIQYLLLFPLLHLIPPTFPINAMLACLYGTPWYSISSINKWNEEKPFTLLYFPLNQHSSINTFKRINESLVLCNLSASFTLQFKSHQYTFHPSIILFSFLFPSTFSSSYYCIYFTFSFLFNIYCISFFFTHLSFYPYSYPLSLSTTLITKNNNNNNNHTGSR